MKIPDSTFIYGQAGIQRGQAQLDQASAKVAQASIPSVPGQPSTVPPSDIREGLLDLPVAQNQMQASTKVLETSDDTLGTLIDIKV